MKPKVLKKNSLRDSFFENTLDGLAYCQMIFDKQNQPTDFVYLEVNNNFTSLTGLKNVVGKKVTEVIPGIKKSTPMLFEIYGRVALTGKQEKFETYVKPLSRWFTVSVYSPKKKFFVSVFQNITDQKIIEKNLENSNIAARNVLEDLNIEKLKLEIARAKEEAILLSIGDGLIATDENGHIILINKAAEKLFGKKSNDFVGKLFSEAITIENENGEIIIDSARPINRALATGAITTTTTAGLTYYYSRKDKTKFPVAIMVTPVILNGNVIGTIEVFRDITKEKEIDKVKSEFVSLASHQLRTPLTAISWYTEMILNGDVGSISPDQKKYLEEIYHGNTRMIALVNTLLNVSCFELGTFKIDLKLTDIVATARNVLNELKPKIEKKKLIIKDNLTPNIPTFLTDPELIGMIFQNLLSNAIEYTEKNGKIELAVSIDNKKSLYIKVSDTGCGIPKKQQGEIFKKLFRADNVRDKETSGRGLGLYIVKSIVENLNGKITFDSKENKGTNFYITLPLKMYKNNKTAN